MHRSPTLLLILSLMIACSRSSPNEQSISPAAQSSYGMPGASPKRMKTTPSDWPLSFEQLDFLMSGRLEKMARRSAEPKNREQAGWKTPQEMVAFAWNLLEADLHPIERDQGIEPGKIHEAVFFLIGLHGDLEDARRLFDRLKSLVQAPREVEASDEHSAHTALAEAVGFFLMRDHFMPQKDRALMEEIEAYLSNCARYGAPSSWPREDAPSGNDDMRRYALKALAISCGEKGRERIQEYLNQPEGTLGRIAGQVCFDLTKRVESEAEEIRRTLQPVLPREI